MKLEERKAYKNKAGDRVWVCSIVNGIAYMDNGPALYADSGTYWGLRTNISEFDIVEEWKDEEQMNSQKFKIGDYVVDKWLGAPGDGSAYIKEIKDDTDSVKVLWAYDKERGYHDYKLNSFWDSDRFKLIPETIEVNSEWVDTAGVRCRVVYADEQSVAYKQNDTGTLCSSSKPRFVASHDLFIEPKKLIYYVPVLKFSDGSIDFGDLWEDKETMIGYYENLPLILLMDIVEVVWEEKKEDLSIA